MRYSKVVSIVKLLFVFYKRSVLNFGIMKSRLFRIIFGIGVLVITAIMSILMFNTFVMTNMSKTLTNTIMDIYSLTTLMWTFVVFLFMKMLFLKKDSFLRFTSQMPVSKIEKNVAIVFSEISIALIVVNIIALSSVIAFVIYGGPRVVLRILCNVFFTCSNVYLLLELINRLVAYLIGIFDLNKMKDTFLICFFMAVFFFIYSIGMPRLTDGILFNYMDNEGTSIIAFFSYIMDNTHFIVSAYLFLALVLVLLAVICLIPDDISIIVKRFIISKYNIENIRFIKNRLDKNRLFKSYFLNVSRRIDNLNLGIIVIFTYFMAMIVKIANPEYAVMLYAVNGIYMCIQTEGIRSLFYQKDYDVVKDYMYLIFSQIIYTYIVSVPFTIVALVKGSTIKNILLMYVIMFCITVFSTFIGIVFVPKKENPISIMAGLVTIIIFGLIMYIGTALLQVTKVVQIIILVLMICVVIYYSLLGLVSLKKESSYEYKKHF